MNENYLTQNERGSILPMLAIVVGSLILFAGLIVDISRKEISEHHAQNCADAAALAGSNVMDGTQAGFRNAKRAALAAAHKCLLYGSVDISAGGGRQTPMQLVAAASPTALVSDTSQLSPDQSFGEPARFQGTTFTAGDAVTITVERGTYWAPKDNSGFLNAQVTDYYEFQSLDGVEEDPTGQGAGTVYLAPNGQRYNLPVYLFANALKVTVSVKTVGTLVMPSFANSAHFSSAEGTAYGIMDNETTACAAPVAIPACSLLLNTSPSANERYLTDEYRADMQCSRELIFAEADPRGIVASPARQDGLIRNDIYPERPEVTVNSSAPIGFPYNPPGTTPISANPRNPFGTPLTTPFGANPYTAVTSITSSRPNDHMLPIEGILGFTDIMGSSTASPTQNTNILSSILSNPNACWPVRLGSSFIPADDRQSYEQIVLGSRSQQIQSNIRNFIQGSALTVRDVFMKNNGEKELNFPRIISKKTRTGRDASGRPTSYTEVDIDSLIHEYPRADGTTSKFRLRDMGEDTWTNPMCHDAQLETEDPTNAKVRPITVMVIAPSDGTTSYCDYNATFSATENGADFPTFHSDPVVVGFVQAYLFDFNFLNLDNEHPQTRLPSNDDLPDTPDNESTTPEFIRAGNPGNPLKADNPLRSLPFFRSGATDLTRGFGDDVEDWLNHDRRDIECCLICEAAARGDVDPGNRLQGCSLVSVNNNSNGNGQQSGSSSSSSSSGPRYDCSRCQVNMQDREPPAFDSSIANSEGFASDCFDFNFRGSDSDGDGNTDWDEFQNIGLDISNPGAFQSVFANINGIIQDYSDFILLATGQDLPAGSALESFGLAIEDSHCLPKRLNDCFPASNAGCWEDPQPRQAGWGCGGLRARLSCSPDIFPKAPAFGTANNNAQRRPALVAVD